MLRPRRAATLVELCIALAVGGLVLGVITATGIRQRRVHAALAWRASGTRQLRHGAEILPIDLRALDARAGDFVAGEARDSSIEIRASVAMGVICAAPSPSEVSLVPAAAQGGRLYSAISSPRVGDTLWALADGDSSDRWIPAAIESVREAPGQCTSGGTASPFLVPGDELLPSLVLELSADVTSSGIRGGSPVRITRLARYSIYRASDGRWYLGYRDAAPAGGFDVVQPVSGPYAGRGGVRFLYLDAEGSPLAPPVDSVHRIAAVEVRLRSWSADVGRAAALSTPPVATTVESLTVVVALRNTP